MVLYLDERRWDALNKSGQTIAQLFIDKLEKTSVFNIGSAIQNGVSNLKLPGLSLLPSSIDLIHVQDRMGDIPMPPPQHNVFPATAAGKTAKKDSD